LIVVGSAKDKLIGADFSRPNWRPISAGILTRANTQPTGGTQEIYPKAEKVVTRFCH